jgi:hypothetical protein
MATSKRDMLKPINDLEGGKFTPGTDGKPAVRVFIDGGATGATGPNGENINTYNISDVEDSGSYPKYYGYLNPDGKWYIMKESNPLPGIVEYRYTKGDSDFATNWGNRATLTYNTYDSVF